MTLCIFAKEPIAGNVKTRLAATIGADAAARLASAFLADTITVVQTLGVEMVIAWSGSVESAPHGTEVWSQGEGDLGKRLETIFARALVRSPWAIALGADSPGVPETNLRAALEVLKTHDAVIGPALDGGYYLLGVSRCEPALLEGIAWSTSTTYAQTVERLVAHGYRVGFVDAWFDVDDADDLLRLDRLLRDGTVTAHETARALDIAARPDRGLRTDDP